MKMLFPGYDMVIALINSQQLWLLAFDQASQISSTDGEGTYKNPPPPEKLLVADSGWVREN